MERQLLATQNEYITTRNTTMDSMGMKGGVLYSCNEKQSTGANK